MASTSECEKVKTPVKADTPNTTQINICQKSTKFKAYMYAISMFVNKDQLIIAYNAYLGLHSAVAANN